VYQNLAILSVFVFFYSIVAGRLERTPISGPIVFVVFGLIFGPLGLNLLTLQVTAEVLRALAELSLALVLFTDAANADLAVLKKTFHIPQRLLLLGLPLTILLGIGAGFLIFGELSLLEVAILSTMLAPTDAALGKAVVTDESIPAEIREGLNVESGLNDGICVPILFVFLTLAGGLNAGGGPWQLASRLVTQEIGIGVAVGLGLTFIAARLIRQSLDIGWVTETWRQIPVVALAGACFALAQWLGGSGFIAAFAGGLLFGGIAPRHKQSLLMAAEGTADTLALVTWVLFGSAVVGEVWGAFNWRVVLYAILSLTLVRMLPVFAVLSGEGLRTSEKLFIGWFGPRGLASIVFAVMVLNQQLPGGRTISMTVVCTIALSILAHGLSANPLVAALTKQLKSSSARVRNRASS